MAQESRNRRRDFDGTRHFFCDSLGWRLEETRKPCGTAQDIQRAALLSHIRVIVDRSPPPIEACPRASASPSRSAAIK
jgi:hypothetical protein